MENNSNTWCCSDSRSFRQHSLGCPHLCKGTSILSPPLPEADQARLHELFGALRGVGLDLPDRVKSEGKTGSS